jgi:signal transduction histidine kinase
LPIIIVSVPMLLAETWFARSWLSLGYAGVVLVLFLLLGPFTWRALLGQHQRTTIPRLLLFTGCSAVLPFLGWVYPYLHLGPGSFLTLGLNGLLVAGLFWAGAWGIGRDIEMAQGIEAAERRAVLLEREAERAQLMALRAHLDPHFLFNTLNAIAEWCREDGEVAETAVLKLSALLREVMVGVKAAHWPLSRELQVIEDLWALHQVRDPDRFQTVIDVPEPLPAVLIPPMLLLPLAENAIKHGPAAGHRGPVTLQLQILPTGGVHVSITNPGAFSGPRPGGEGLAMVHKRLALSYSERASFSIAAAGERTVATVTLPALPEEVS